MKNFFLLFAAYALLFICSCAKDSPSPSFEDLTSEQRSAQPGYLLVSTAGDAQEAVSCDNIPFEESFVSIRYRLFENGISSPHCFTETELKEIFFNAGLTKTQVNYYLENLFYNDKGATPELANEIGGCIDAGYALPNDYMPDCFSINAIGRSGYPGGDLVTQIGCAPGFIDLYTVRQSKACGSGFQSIIEGGFSGIRLKKKSTSEIVTIAFSASLNDLYEPLIASGLTPEQAVEVAQNVMQGKYSMREVWNLFQFRIVPNLPLVIEINTGGSSDWELWHVGLGIFAGDGSIVSFYFAQGNAPLNCLITGPYFKDLPSGE